MKYFTIIFWTVLLTGCFVQGSLRERRGFSSSDALCIVAQREQLHENSKEHEMVQRRQMSRVFVVLTSKVQEFKQSTTLTKLDFDELCKEIEAYKQEHLELLVDNKLHYDDGHDPRDNHFNSDLVRQLEELARKYSFSPTNIPLRVVQDPIDQELSEFALVPTPEDVQASFDGIVQRYDIPHALSPTPRSLQDSGSRSDVDSVLSL